MGVHPSSSNLSIFQEYMAHQSGNVVITTTGREFSKADIGKNIFGLQLIEKIQLQD